MIKFLKDNANLIWKCVLNRIAIVVFALIVLIASKMINETLFHIAGVVAIALYLFLIYTMMIEKGNEDKIKIDGGRMVKNDMYGLYVYLCANALNVLLCIATFILYYFADGTIGSFTNEAYGFFRIITHYYNAIYISITSLVPNFPAIYLISVIPGALCAYLSYFAGVRGAKHFMPESKKLDNERRR